MHYSERSESNVVSVTRSIDAMIKGGASKLSCTIIYKAYISLYRRELEEPVRLNEAVEFVNDRIEAFKGDSGLDPGEVAQEIKEVAWESTGVVRNERGLVNGLERFREIRRDMVPRIKANNLRDLISSLECSNLSWVGEMVAACALERRESRGQHAREDYPEKDDKN